VEKGNKMLNLRYTGEKTRYPVSFKKINNIVQIMGDFPIKTKGFVLTRIDDENAFTGDYSGYTTIYREIEGGVQFSDDGSTYVAPTPSEPLQEPAPTLEDIQEAKITEMNTMQQELIQAGVDVTLTDGTVEHFTLTDHDQTSLMGLQSKVLAGEEQIPWHTSDETEHCKFYSNADMAMITEAAMAFVTWHVTYYRDLRIYIRSLTNVEDVEAVTYGKDIPEEFRSEPLKSMMLAELG
jgi:hypothetical protein